MKLFMPMNIFSGEVNFKNGFLEISSKGFFIELDGMREGENKNNSMFDAAEFHSFGPSLKYIQRRGNIRIKLIIRKAYLTNAFIVLLVIEDKKGKVKGKFYLTRDSEWKLKTKDIDLSFKEDAAKIPIPIADFDFRNLLEKLKGKKAKDLSEEI